MTAAQKWPTLYRVYDTIGPGGLTLHWQEFTVIGETPKCWYVIRSDREYLLRHEAYAPELKRHRKLVLKEQSGRRYCYADKRLAMESYQSRKHWQKSHAKLAIARSAAGIAAAKELLASDAEISLPVRQPSKYIEGLGWGGDY
uniref:Uncharacterized protein n=1 Tax=Pseudomonas phage Touem01 TaxID=3138548 RepID=A0AAU6W1K1_9VIRU